MQARLLALESRVFTLEAENSRLRETIAKLEERLGTDSHNSSKPPSSDPATKPRHPTRGSGRKPGGQPGHDGHHRALIPTEQCTRVEKVVPERCARCRGRNLVRMASPPSRHQVTDVPPVRPEVTEWQCFDAECRDCGLVTTASLPDGVPRGAFGCRALALVAYLSGALRLGRRSTEKAMVDLFGVEMSLGSVAAVEQIACTALEGPYQQAHRAAQEQPVAHFDETGWRERMGKAWMWVMATPIAVVFHIDVGRGHEAAQKIIGAFKGILVSDRWVVYNCWAMWMRQLCWAHLARAFVKFSERGGKSRKIGDALQAEVTTMFKWWHKVRDGTMTRANFIRNMRPLRLRVEDLLRRGRDTCVQKATAGTCREILKLAPALWTFVTESGVEPTNNVAERSVRRGVLWRKTSLGSFAANGSRYVERMLTVVETLRIHNRGVLDYLTAAIDCHLNRRPIPSLLPGCAAIMQSQAA